MLDELSCKIFISYQDYFQLHEISRDQKRSVDYLCCRNSVYLGLSVDVMTRSIGCLIVWHCGSSKCHFLLYFCCSFCFPLFVCNCNSLVGSRVGLSLQDCDACCLLGHARATYNICIIDTGP
jgi:hypothetical protein